MTTIDVDKLNRAMDLLDEVISETCKLHAFYQGGVEIIRAVGVMTHQIPREAACITRGDTIDRGLCGCATCVVWFAAEAYEATLEPLDSQ